jgi:hypothetical protein
MNVYLRFLMSQLITLYNTHQTSSKLSPTLYTYIFLAFLASFLCFGRPDFESYYTPISFIEINADLQIKIVVS